MSVTLIGAAIVVFFVIRVVPGNPIAMMLPPGATDDDVARLSALYGLDKSIFEQFVIWLGGVFRGDFGTSISLRQPVMPLVLGTVAGDAGAGDIRACHCGGDWRHHGA
jgi:ABC-type dipeptide/oligopeptide/nickel transport system permease component